MSAIKSETIVSQLFEISDLFASGVPFNDKMNGLCQLVAASLGSDRSSILLWNGDRYVGTYSFGLAPELQAMFKSKQLSDLFVELLADVEDYIILDGNTHPGISEVAQVHSAVVCPLSDSSGRPLAILNAGFVDPRREFDELSAKLLLGIGRIVKAALLAEEARLQHHRSIASRRALQLEVDQSEQERRRRIRAEIQNSSIQEVDALKDGIVELASRVDEPRILDGLNELVSETEQAAASLRKMFASRSDDLSEENLQKSLVSLVRSFSVSASFRTRLDNAVTVQPPSEVRNELIQIVRQALSNAELHSHASLVTISARTERQGTSITVADDGCGFEPETVSSNRFGLLSMRERANNLGGEFALRTQVEAGTTIEVWVPHTRQTLSRDAILHGPQI